MGKYTDKKVNNTPKAKKIKLLEQSLNEQIEEKQVYMNMLKEREE